MNIQHRQKPLLITLLLCGTAPLWAAETEPAAKPAPWHVENAELRVPVKVAMKGGLLRMPPQVYLADLKPLNAAPPSQASAKSERPRVVVLTDITNEPDDEESLVRFLVSSSD